MCQPNICVLNETIDSEYYVLVSELDNDVERFKIEGNTNAEYLPAYIGTKFPNLKDVSVTRCGLTVVRDFFFENMRRLQNLLLVENKISIIEPRAFTDLVKVKSLDMKGNLIETLDGRLFNRMIKLESLDLVENKIAIITPLAFSGLVKLKSLDMQGNFIKTLDDKLFQKMSKLESLDLSNNQIQLLSPLTFVIPGSDLQILDLRANDCIDELYDADGNMEDLQADIILNCTQG